ncbi:MAG TPA: hypothetical protein PKI03_12440 [Pseudomonadota bacterium]|nr:hypothetical protein [Pseudomonadota bacterium]
MSQRLPRPALPRRARQGMTGLLWSLSLLFAGSAWADSPAGETRPEPSAPAVPEGRREAAAEARPDGKRPQVRTYTSVMVVDDPAKVPRLPTPSREAADRRESVRELRREINDLRRDLRKDREGPAGAGHPPEAGGPVRDGRPATPARTSPPGGDASRAGGAAGPDRPGERDRHSERDRPMREPGGPRGERPSPREPKPERPEGRPLPPSAR